ncbi:MAG: hypothetical protein ACJAZN_002369 [Planctomycetota bacterium]|jgi:hypothetical protein
MQRSNQRVAKPMKPAVRITLAVTSIRLGDNASDSIPAVTDGPTLRANHGAITPRA